MNLPNKITIFRVLLVPVFVVWLLVPNMPGGRTVALVIYCVACFSDFLDGYLARKNNLVTDFGKFLDPLADKLLVCSALICFIDMEFRFDLPAAEAAIEFPAWVTLIIIAREFTISAFRVVAVDNGIVIAASYLAKAKTVVQMFLCIFFIADWPFAWWRIGARILMYTAVVLTVASLVEYIYKNRRVIMHNTK